MSKPVVNVLKDLYSVNARLTITKNLNEISKSALNQNYWTSKCRRRAFWLIAGLLAYWAPDPSGFDRIPTAGNSIVSCLFFRLLCGGRYSPVLINQQTFLHNKLGPNLTLQQYNYNTYKNVKNYLCKRSFSSTTLNGSNSAKAGR